MTENLIEGAAPSAPAAPAAVAETTATGVAAPVALSDNLFASLGLGDVEADPNAVPDGKYDAVVRSADIVHIKSNNKVSAVFNYSLEGSYAPAQLAQFQNLGINPVLEDGKIKSFTPTMSEQNKSYLKKAFTDLGIPEDEVTATPTTQLLAKVVGRKCRITVRKNGAYRNVVDCEYRAPSAEETPVDPNATGEAPAPVGTPEQSAAEPF